VGTAGVLIGVIMLRYGVVPLLVWHFTVDAIYTALLLLRSGNAYYVISGAVASGILLLPLLVSLALYLRRGGFLPATGLTNGDIGFVPAPAETAAATASVPDVRPLPQGALFYAGAVALILVSSLFVPDAEREPLVEDRIGREGARALAERFLRVNGVDPEPWHSVAYQGTGFPDDEEVRSAKPQDEGGIPTFSDTAAQYVIEQGGPQAFRKLTRSQLPLSYWVVRFFQPEKKEEWKVLVDTNRSRVAAFVHPVAEDAPASAPPTTDEAKARAAVVAEKLGYPAASYSVLEVGTENRPKRTDTTVVLESKPPGIGEARPRLTAVFHGPKLASFLPSIRVPESFVRAHRKRSVAEWLLLGVKVVAAGALVGLGIILFLRLVKQPEFRWKSLLSPLFWTGLLAAAGIANTVPYLFRQYPTDTPISLFRLGMGVSQMIGLLGVLLMAAVGFTLYAGARPGWATALRHRGAMRDALWRAAIAAAGSIGLAHWAHVVSSRVPALYEPDPSLPGSLQYVVPALDVLWGAARGAFGIAALAAAAALAWRSSLFRTTPGRLLGAAAIAVALLPTDIHSAARLVADYLPGLAMAAWLGVCAFLLLRDHVAAWVLFGLLAFGGRGALELLAQPAAADRAAGGFAVVLLIVAGFVLLAGKRERALAPREFSDSAVPPIP
jgi:hypothetical protein